MTDCERSESDDFDDGWCGDYPEHDYFVRDEADGDVAYECRRCGAELIETSEDRGDATGQKRSPEPDA